MILRGHVKEGFNTCHSSWIKTVRSDFFLYNQNLWWSAWQLSKLADSLGCCEVRIHCIPCSCFGTHGKEISIAILQYYFMNLAAMLEHTKILELGSRDNGYNNLTIGPTNDAHHITSKYCVKTSLWLQEANILGTEEGWREKQRQRSSCLFEGQILFNSFLR